VIQGSSEENKPNICSQNHLTKPIPKIKIWIMVSLTSLPSPPSIKLAGHLVISNWCHICANLWRKRWVTFSLELPTENISKKKTVQVWTMVLIFEIFQQSVLITSAVMIYWRLRVRRKSEYTFYSFIRTNKDLKYKTDGQHIQVLILKMVKVLFFSRKLTLLKTENLFIVWNQFKTNAEKRKILIQSDETYQSHVKTWMS
jgi:hypothetical protein